MITGILVVILGFVSFLKFLFEFVWAVVKLYGRFMIILLIAAIVMLIFRI